MLPLLKISAFSLVNALGWGAGTSLEALRAMRGGLRPQDYDDVALNTWIGRVANLEQHVVSREEYDCRNNRLALATLNSDDFENAVQAARRRYGAERIGIFLGTSTSGIRHTELAYAQKNGQALGSDFPYRGTHNVFSVAEFVRDYLKLRGPAAVHSTACSSSAKVFAVAHRHIQAGFCDAAVVGGVDSLCLTTLYGFNSLGLISGSPCRPWDRERDGISIGEAAGLALLEKDGDDDDPAWLLGYGESSDAYHISSPHPDGAGAALAMRRALRSASLDPEQVDYINTHGTATPGNDSSEDRAVVEVFGTQTPCSSTKGWVGHTLGAAGITEALFGVLCMRAGFLPGTLNLQKPDEALSARVLQGNQPIAATRLLSNSFGFGGNNCSLLLGRRHE